MIIPVNTASILPFIEPLKSASNLVIVTHKNPDGDAIGSSLGILLLLEKYGVKAHVVVEDELPYFLHFLPRSQDVIIYNSDPRRVQEFISSASFIICTDFSQLNRCGKLEPFVRQSSAPRILFDHHPEPDLASFQAVYHDVTASSTSELIAIFASSFFTDVPITTDWATCIYTGMVTDTGCFRFSLRPQTFQIAANLLQSNIPVQQIITQIFDSYSFQRIQLTGFVLQNKLRYLPEYRTAYFSLSETEMMPFNPRRGDTEGLVNHTLSIEGVVLGVFFNQKPDDTIRISFRSKGAFACNDIASKFFNGGGHRNASGGQYAGTIEEAIEYFLKVLPQYKDQLISLSL